MDICDYEGNVLCNIYDNTSDVSGQATDVFVKRERNGTKTLSFVLPSTCETSEGIEDNYRLTYLIADYKIRTQTKRVDGEIETDWYLISEPKVNHEAFSKKTTVTAKHISQLLSTKNLGLEFSDEEGNNVGTCYDIAKTILDGTGWSLDYVEDFKEDDGTTKIRSLIAPEKTGAFALINKLCELFEATPIYKGDGRKVDIVSLNPFSKDLEPGEIPQNVLDGEGVIELHYDRNIKNLERVLNTDSIVTKLYYYGSYGDRNGLASLQRCEHLEYTFGPGTAGEYMFRTVLGAKRYFTIDRDFQSLVYSELDFTSRSYIWDGEKAYLIYKEPKGEYTYDEPCPELSYETESVRNYFSFLLDFDYYQEVHLLSDNMLQMIAKYQRETPEYIQAAEDAAEAMTKAEGILSETAESNNGFLRLNVKRIEEASGSSRIILDKTEEYPAGIIYRTDYDQARKNYFTWHVVKQIKDNGDPVSGVGSVVYIIHDTTPTTWDKAYVKLIGSETEDYYELDTEGNVVPSDYYYAYGNRPDPARITLWASGLTYTPTDRVYLYSTNSISGSLGASESEVESNIQTLQTSTKIATEEHPTIFGCDEPDLEGSPADESVLQSYGWFYTWFSNSYDFGRLYFCWGVRGERSWHRAWIGTEVPAVVNGDYFYNTKEGKLYKGDGEWVWLETAEEKRVADNFAKVVQSCNRHERLYKGLHEKYVATVDNLQPGNYAMQSEYGFFWAFTTTQVIPETFTIDTSTNLGWQDDDPAHIVKPEEKPYDTLDFPSSNDLAGMNFSNGSIDPVTGVAQVSNTVKRTISILAHENLLYEFDLPANTYVCYYQTGNVFIESEVLTGAEAGTGTFLTPANTKYFKFVTSSEVPSTSYVRAVNYNSIFFIKEKLYTILTCEGVGEQKGIIFLTKQMADLADQAYLVALPAMKAAQQEVIDRDNAFMEYMGDMYREGWHTDINYVEGDEARLYKDALETHKQIAKPEATYNFTFLDLYGANHGYTIEELYDIEWPDIEITNAAHLIDHDIDTNCWAYIDVLNKCYDQPWKTELEINTRLSLIGQQSFTDVLAKIAEVANETRANQNVYKRAAAFNSAGRMAAERLEGSINANRVYVTGGQSNWYTDEGGNIIFESADGTSAMMLSGHGIALAASRDVWGSWEWRGFVTGYGTTADEIIAGYMSGERIEVGSIEADRLSSAAGAALDISSNVALNIYATEDGTRPSGSTRTTDGIITINAGYTDDYGNKIPAKINISAGADGGGELNLYGGAVVNLESGSEMNLHADTRMSIGAGAGLDIASDGEIHIASGAAFMVDAGNFNIDREGNVTLNGNVTAYSGDIAGFIIGSHEQQGQVVRRYMYAGGTDSLHSTSNGVYLGTDGVNIGGGQFIVESNGNTCSIQTNAASVLMGTLTSGNDGTGLMIDAINGNTVIRGDNTMTVSAGKVLNLLTQGEVKIGKEDNPFTFGATTPTDTSQKSDAYMYNGMSTINSVQYGIYVGTNGIGIGGGNFKATADGNVYLAGEIHAARGEIGGWSIGDSMLYSGTGNNFVALNTGESDYRMWIGDEQAVDAPFSVEKDGTLRSTLGYIGGWTIADTSLTGNKTGLALTENDTDTAIWAGHTNKTIAPFQVHQDGSVYSVKGLIGGWTIDTLSLTGRQTGMGITYTGTDKAFWAGASATGEVSNLTLYDAKGGNVVTESYNGTLAEYQTEDDIWGSAVVDGVRRYFKQAEIDTSKFDKNTAKFYVQQNGRLYAQDAYVKGEVHADSFYGNYGNIGGWAIDADGLYTTSGTNIRLSASQSRAAIYVGRDRRCFAIERDGSANIWVHDPLESSPIRGSDGWFNAGNELWKLGYYQIVGYSDKEYITVSTNGNDSGTRINFKQAEDFYLDTDGNSIWIQRDSSGYKASADIVKSGGGSHTGRSSSGSVSICGTTVYSWSHDASGAINGVSLSSYSWNNGSYDGTGYSVSVPYTLSNGKSGTLDGYVRASSAWDSGYNNAADKYANSMSGGGLTITHASRGGGTSQQSFTVAGLSGYAYAGKTVYYYEGGSQRSFTIPSDCKTGNPYITTA